MSPGPSRRFGSQARTVNFNAHKKGSTLKQSLEQSCVNSRILLDQELGHDGLDDATHPLTPMDLTLPPFKLEQGESSQPGSHHSAGNLATLACQAIDEDILDDVEGMPTRAQWKSIVESYLACLHPSKRHKSLISQEVYKMIFRTLKDPDATRLGTPQFRFWARKMFQLVEAPNNILVVTNAGRPVAIKEHIYDILCMCHSECGHGGRDKTCKVLREYYTWVPKELISNFVKECPTCAPRKLAASRSKEKRVETTPVPSEERLLCAPRFSVERLQDFGQLPSPVSDGPRQLKLPPLDLDVYPSPATSQAPTVTMSSECGSPGSYFIQAKFPANNSVVTLPPLSGGLEGTYNTASDTSKQMSLPPLIQYLTRNYDFKDELQYPADADAGEGSTEPEIPIDPTLFSTAPTEAPGNALHLQLHAPAQHSMARQHAQLTIDPALTQTENAEATSIVTWEFPSVASVYGGDGDNSALYSASTASIGLPTPSQSGQISPAGSGYISSLGYYSPMAQSMQGFDGIQYAYENKAPMHSDSEKDPKVKVEDGLARFASPPLFSPRPVKIEDTPALLEMAAAESMEEINN
ncbi:hypothetical protein ACEPAI_2070 [Sanghuangporus weigelae]